MNLLTIPRTFLKVEENVKNEGILSPVSEMVADGALLSFNGTETHHITPRERERGSSLPRCLVAACASTKSLAKRRNKIKKARSEVRRGLRSSWKTPTKKRQKRERGKNLWKKVKGRRKVCQRVRLWTHNLSWVLPVKPIFLVQTQMPDGQQTQHSNWN